MAAPDLVILKFGNRAITPGSGIVPAWLDLNDGVTWRSKPPVIADDILVTLAQQSGRGQSSKLMGDVGPKVIKVSSVLDEVAGTKLSIQKALLTQVGEQFLTLDNVSQIVAECRKFDRTALRYSSPYAYAIELEFVCRIPAAEDIAATTPAAVNLAGGNPGVTTNFTITYAGSVLARPVFTLNVPNTNTVTIAALRIQNTASGESLLVTFSTPLTASTAHTVTVDTDALTITDDLGVQYDPVGTFPKLYGPAGTANTFIATLTTGAGASTGVTLGSTYKNRWEL
jgi:hypothetical protein